VGEIAVVEVGTCARIDPGEALVLVLVLVVREPVGRVDRLREAPCFGVAARAAGVEMPEVAHHAEQVVPVALDLGGAQHVLQDAEALALKVGERHGRVGGGPHIAATCRPLWQCFGACTRSLGRPRWPRRPYVRRHAREPAAGGRGHGS
jgi:hypothetical protein